jgi:hypothetical protein
MVSISHAIGIVTRDKEKPGQEHGNGCFKHRSTSISKYQLQSLESFGLWL